MLIANSLLSLTKILINNNIINLKYH